ncbi:hydroxysteroid dehydrogenase-like protein 2 [Palaemon carinicauda]|uniref:hydroxysteroid dehydrogenase-like protein 2 n=1 Tax=Palaemon carinicauda TaxID=392227 RepID=UPI0035B5FD35
MAQNTGKLKGKTLFITGASRGIGKAIALKAARDGANIIIAAKTAEPHPKLPGTIYTAAKEIEEAGGQALPCIVDVRDETSVAKAVELAVERYGGIDIVVNNASAISLTGTLETPMKRYDLMHHINTRGTYLVSKLCIPHLRKSSNPHILNISPPLNMNPRWFKDHAAYTMAKYGMSMCALGMAEEFRDEGIACNALWPETAVTTAATKFLGGGGSMDRFSRKPEIMADAAYVMLCKDSRSYTGNFAIDSQVLTDEGIADLSPYAVDPGSPLAPDFFLDGYEEKLSKIGGDRSKGRFVDGKDTLSSKL